ncbi:GNAT family N-acetyltransferase [Paenisporosarcina cavernae]|uniref:N-acetyltransferase n=1 Tax=Paenisporosarcina cavernae TaxID=2320858 RepID=A0A385YPA2_9BACL|nr:GNAT family N-acetyltransferase [Paenisporosarcina cavernae]AYC28525.1 N-acetyltransferase [Paenisporosarcina cavernae]
MLQLQLLQLEDADKLLEFERVNRCYFEQSVPTRGDSYYIPTNFLSTLGGLLDEQVQEKSLFYLIWEKDELIGRMNLVDINEENSTGTVEYRIGEAHSGKGYAKAALLMLVEQVLIPRGIRGLAKTTIDNVASQKVLESVGFVPDSSLSDEEFVHYIWTYAEVSKTN